jgi:hypothetical protein
LVLRHLWPDRDPDELTTQDREAGEFAPTDDVGCCSLVLKSQQQLVVSAADGVVAVTIVQPMQ